MVRFFANRVIYTVCKIEFGFGRFDDKKRTILVPHFDNLFECPTIALSAFSYKRVVSIFRQILVQTQRLKLSNNERIDSTRGYMF
jgi:hypothetical protein